MFRILALRFFFFRFIQKDTLGFQSIDRVAQTLGIIFPLGFCQPSPTPDGKVMKQE